ncbi:hypothetical protein, partial [Rhodococcus qingshengii]|uniref:hypothetical protein n=1 Tax=Rhodococcus qingshengii TaxID=334542 RepID=UPI002F90FB2D
EEETIDFITHPDQRVRDLSYGRSRMRQLVDLAKGSFFDMGFGTQDGDEAAAGISSAEDWPTSRLEIYIKEKPRGPGYVCDIVYHSENLPVTVYAVVINRGHGLEIAELELFRTGWGCFDGHDNYVHPDDQERAANFDDPATLITSDVLRRIPLGEILARLERDLPDDSWRTDGIRVLGGPDMPTEELTRDQIRALETTSMVNGRRRGRPEISNELLIDIANAYIDEAAVGKGAIGRLAETFDRPEPTVRDWISAARRRGFLAPTTPGRRGAAPGPNLPPRSTARDFAGIPDTVLPNLSKERRRHLLRMVEGEGILDADISEEARLLYVVSGLMCNDIGVVKQNAVTAGMNNPQIVQTAITILDKARRRQAAQPK